jgi:hypothetical protein
MMDVSTIQTEIMYIGKGIPKYRSSMFNGRHTFDHVAVKVAIIVLREVDKVSRTIVVYCDVYAWKLVETNIMISYCRYYRHKISKGGSEPAIHAKEVVPSIGASWHVIIICNISTYKEDIRLKCGCDFGEIDCSWCIP